MFLLIFNDRALLDMKDFLVEPHARSLETIFGKQKETLDLIQEYQKETVESKNPLVIKEGQIDGIPFEFIGKRKEGKKKIEAFSIMFKEEMYNLLVLLSSLTM